MTKEELVSNIKKMEAVLTIDLIPDRTKDLIKAPLERAKEQLERMHAQETSSRPSQTGTFTNLDQEISEKLDSFEMFNISQLRSNPVMRARIIEDVKTRIASGRLTIEEALVEIEWVFIEGEG
jgi:hypothetical protein